MTATCPRHGGPWGSDLTCITCTTLDEKPRQFHHADDWQYEVANGDTLLGFDEWMQHQEEASS